MNWLVLCGVACCPHLLLLGCNSTTRNNTSVLHVDCRQPETACLLIYVDGLAASIVDELRSAGRLPHLDRIFFQEGTVVEDGIVCIPSVTYANAASLITGQFPHRHTVTGNTWFDRYRRLFRDYGSPGTYRLANEDIRGATLFERLPEKLTVSVQAHTRRGAAVTLDNPLDSGLDWLFGNYERVDARVGAIMPRLVRLANCNNLWPDILFVYFPGLDEIGHRHGPQSDRYRAAVTAIDQHVGQLVRRLDELLPNQRRRVALVTDHGHVGSEPSARHDLRAWLTAERPIRLYPNRATAGNFTARLRALQPFDAVLTIGADRHAALHLKGRGGWDERPTPAVLEAFIAGSHHPRATPLWRAPGVDLICWRRGTQVIVCGADGQLAEIAVDHRNGKQRFTYRPCVDAHLPGATPGDPLGYGGEWRTEPSAANAMGSRAWLQATADSSYPDFVPQIYAWMTDQLAPDVVSFARSGASFTNRYRAGHGGVAPADMRVYFGFSGTDIPSGLRISTARLVDVLPTLLEWPAKANPNRTLPAIDGQIIPELAPAPAPANEQEYRPPTTATAASATS